MYITHVPIPMEARRFRSSGVGVPGVVGGCKHSSQMLGTEFGSSGITVDIPN